MSSSRFCCSFDNAKKSFYRAFNTVFNKVGRVASQIVVIELLMSKCVPVLYYGSECCPVSKSQFNSLEFAIRGSFMKIFNTRSKEIANYCMEMFNVQNPHYTITKRKCKFLSNIMLSKNVLCELCRESAEKELKMCAYPSN